MKPVTPNDHQPKRLSIEAIVICAIAGIFLPIGWFVWLNANWIRASWVGRFMEYLLPMLFPRVFSPFLPLVGFAMVAMALVLVSLRRFGGSFVVRFGLLTGVVLAFQYAAISAGLMDSFPGHPSVLTYWGFGEGPVTSLLFFLGFSTGIPLAIFGLWVLVKGRFGWRPAVLFLIPMLLVPAAIAVGQDLYLYEMMGNVPVFLVYCIPFWWLAASLVLVVWLRRRVPRRPHPVWAGGLLCAGWLLAYAVAWGWSIVRSGEFIVRVVW